MTILRIIVLQMCRADDNTEAAIRVNDHYALKVQVLFPLPQGIAIRTVLNSGAQTP